MIIGICEIELHIPASSSLKSKRHVIKGLKKRIRNKFNVSISEIDFQDLWQRCCLGVAIVATDTQFAHSVLSQVVNLVERETKIDLLDYRIEMR